MMIRWLFFSILFMCIVACQENGQTKTHSKIKAQKFAKNNEQNLSSKAQTPIKIKPKEEKELFSCVLILPEPVDPDPYDPYDPYAPIDPLEPPGYISEPIDVLLPPTSPKSIRDSIVNFPATAAFYGSNVNDFNKYVDSKIAGTAVFQYLNEIGAEGRIYVRLLIDINGKIRAIDFLKFTTKDLEILRSPLQQILVSMPHWSPAKNEQGQAVVSELTLPIRIPLFE
jgi:hypothetical protein